jgi:hypothetical protein
VIEPAIKEDEPLNEKIGEMEMRAESPIPCAYALIPDPKKPGFYFAVRMHSAYAEKITHLEYSGRSSVRSFGVNRILNDLHSRHRKEGGWDK